MEESPVNDACTRIGARTLLARRPRRAGHRRDARPGARDRAGYGGRRRGGGDQRPRREAGRRGRQGASRRVRRRLRHHRRGGRDRRARHDRGAARPPRLPGQQRGGARSAAPARDHGRRLSPPDRDQPDRAVRALARRRAAHDETRSGPARLHQLDGRAAIVPGRPCVYRIERWARGADARAGGRARRSGNRRQRDRAGVLPDGAQRAVLQSPAHRRDGAAHSAPALRPSRRDRRRRHLSGLRRGVLHHGPGADGRRRTLGRSLRQERGDT